MDDRMITVSMRLDQWEALVAAAKSYHEIVSQDGDDESRASLDTLASALDDIDQQPLPESSR